MKKKNEFGTQKPYWKNSFTEIERKKKNCNKTLKKGNVNSKLRIGLLERNHSHCILITNNLATLTHQRVCQTFIYYV